MAISRCNFIVIYQVFFLALIHGKNVTVNMLQCGPSGTRAVGANITLVSNVSAASTGITQVAMFAINTTHVLENVATYIYGNWSDVDTSTEPKSTPVPFMLDISASPLVDDTRSYTWEFYDLPENYNGLILRTDVQQNGLSDTIDHPLNISSCNTSLTVRTFSQDSFYNIISNSSGHFTAEGNCSCSDHGELYHVSGIKAEQVATCSEYARWEPCQSESLQCWSAPQDIDVSQINKTAGDLDPFNCSFTEGFPNSTEVLYKVNNKIRPSNYILESSDNGKSLICEVVSKYTEATGNTAVSTPQEITVYFPPEYASLPNATIMIPLNGTEKLTFSFSANPNENGILSTYVKILNSDNEVPKELYYWATNITKIRNTTQYERVLGLNLALAEETQTYEVCANSSSPKGEDCAKLNISNKVSTTSKTTDVIATTFEYTIDAGSPNQGGISTGIIIGVAIGVLAVLSIVAVVYFMRRNHGNIKEERINEIYEASPGPGPSIETVYTGTGENSRSEMTTNVAYEASPHQLENQDVYTTVNREDKKKGRTEKDETKKGSAAATSPEENVPAVTDVYAMVKK